jgi:uncharacterized cupin superfamily protein
VRGVNLFDPTWDAEVDTGEGATLRAVRVGRHAGAERLAATLYELEPGAPVSPLHFHHGNEELLFVLEGTPTLRHGQDNERLLAAGEIVAFPAGPRGTHQVLNRSNTSARVLICATNAVPDVAEQVEHERLAIMTADGLRLAPATEPIAQERPRRSAR